MGVKTKRKINPTSFLKIVGRKDARRGERPEKEGQLVEFRDDQIPIPEVPTRSKREWERKKQKRCQESSDREKLACWDQRK